MAAGKVIYGNIVTMNEKQPRAQAMAEYIRENPGKELYKAFGYSMIADCGIPPKALYINGEKYTEKRPAVIYNECVCEE